MKIALIGTHGIGKTTAVLHLASELKKLSYNAGIVKEVARGCPLPINENATKKSQEWMFLKHCLNEIEEEVHYDIVISDRSILDVYAYYYRLFGKHEGMEGFVREKMKEYDLLFKMPLNTDYLKKDKFRSTNKQFQLDIENVINKLIPHFKGEVHEFKSLEETLSVIKEKITVK